MNICQASGWCGLCISRAITVPSFDESFGFYWCVASFLYITSLIQIYLFSFYSVIFRRIVQFLLVRHLVLYITSLIQIYLLWFYSVILRQIVQFLLVRRPVSIHNLTDFIILSFQSLSLDIVLTLHVQIIVIDILHVISFFFSKKYFTYTSRVDRLD